MNDAVFLFPGQGSQYVGMGKSLWETFPYVRQMFDEASEIAERDLAALCFEGPDSLLVQTEHVQPVITLVNLAMLHVLRAEGIEPIATAGHSLGEYAALCAAGSLSFAETIRLVCFRGAVMKEAAARHPGSMTAIFGVELAALQAICREVVDVGSVEVANHNSPRQVILTGEPIALQRAAELAKKSGAKLIVPLKVSGPWHSRFMIGAAARMRETLAQSPFAIPSCPVISNATADLYPGDAIDIRNGLAEQMVRPVLWNDSMRRLLDEGHRVFVEVGPGKVLSGLMRDIDRETRVTSVQDVDSLGKLLALRPDPVSS